MSSRPYCEYKPTSTVGMSEGSLAKESASVRTTPEQRIFAACINWLKKLVKK